MDIRVTGAEQLDALARRCRAAGDRGKGLRTELGKAIRTATKPVVADVRAAVRAVDSSAHGEGGGSVSRHAHAVARMRKSTSRSIAAAGRRAGLRESIARAVVVKTRMSGRTAGVRIVVDASRLPADQRRLPRYLDGQGRWRHPVYGNRDVPVTQTGQPWFEVTIRRRLPAVRQQISAAMDHVARQVEG